MRRTFRCLSLSGLIVLAGSTAFAQSGKLPDETRTRLEAVVSKFMSANGVPGISIAVVKDGEFVWSKGFGMADLENSVPATPNTLYRLGSVSKPLTATAAMELWQSGKIDLDAPVQKYCPSFPEKPWPITTREVLGHLGGIRHYKASEGTKLENDLEIDNTRHFDDPISAGLQFFASDPLVAQPGTKFHYSTQGFTLVGCVMEGAAHQKYVDVVRETVFVPAGMSDSQADDRFKIIAHRTRFYQKDKSGAVENADLLDSSYKIPGGGWLSSADDLAKFEVALLNDTLMKRSTRDIMWTPQKTSDGKLTSYGLGWGIGKIDGVNDVGHSGGQQGTSTDIVMAPTQRDGVVVLINTEGIEAGTLANQLMQILLGTAADNQVNSSAH
jgi:serine beta-lactamase-like protein LACTB, mitochondrial